MSQHLPVPLMDLTTYAKAYKDGLWKWKTDEATDRIRELEERLHERDLAVAALAQERNELETELLVLRRAIGPEPQRWCNENTVVVDGCECEWSCESTLSDAIAAARREIEEEVGRE